MNKLIRSAFILALLIMTQIASSQWVGLFEANTLDVKTERRDSPIRPDEEVNSERQVWVSAGEGRTRKIVDNEFTFTPHSNERVHAIRLVGVRTSVIIRSVVVELRNGQEYEIREIEGRLREGQRARVNFGFHGERIKEIRVISTSENLTGSRGVFRLDLRVDRSFF